MILEIGRKVYFVCLTLKNSINIMTQRCHLIGHVDASCAYVYLLRIIYVRVVDNKSPSTACHR